MITYTVEVYSNGGKYWYLNGKRHREDGPAIECSNGGKYWYLNDKRHREDGPAIEDSAGGESWYLNDKLHREDGPAIEYSDGFKAWFILGEQLTEQQFNRRMSPVKELTLTQLQDLLGYNIKIIEG